MAGKTSKKAASKTPEVQPADKAEAPKKEDLPKIDAQLFEARLLSNKMVLEYLKQVATVSSAALVLSLTIATKIGGESSLGPAPWLLPLSWLCLLGSVFISVYGIGQTPHRLDDFDGDDKNQGHKRSDSFAAGRGKGGYESMERAGCLLFAGLLSLGIFGFFVVLAQPDAKPTEPAEPTLKAIQKAKEALAKEGFAFQKIKLKATGSAITWEASLTPQPGSKPTTNP